MDAALGALILAIPYFLPSIVAVLRHHGDKGFIIVINLFLGWTFFGWVYALARACGNRGLAHA